MNITISAGWRRVLVLVWHLLAVGGFLIAYLSTDEGELAEVHAIAGYVVIGAVMLHLALALAQRRFRMPKSKIHLAHILVVVVLAVVVMASALSGFPALAGVSLHEMLSYIAAALVTAHVAVVLLAVAE